MWTAAIQTDDGIFTAHFSERGVGALDFPQPGVTREGLKSPSSLPPNIRCWLALTNKALFRVLSGQIPNKLPPFDLSVGTAFQQLVWRALLKIRPGQFRTYAQLAVEVGRPKAARAVGAACGANPIPVLIPCHRVLASGGGLGGFSGGLEWKRRLLEREGVWLI